MKRITTKSLALLLALALALLCAPALPAAAEEEGDDNGKTFMLSLPGPSTPSATLFVYDGQEPRYVTLTVPGASDGENIEWRRYTSTVTLTLEDGTTTDVNDHASIRVYALESSKASVTAEYNGQKYYFDINIRRPVTGVSLNKRELTLTVGQSEGLTAPVTPTSASDPDTTWTSSDESVATVSGSNGYGYGYGFVTAVSPGTATITVTTNDGNYTASCTVTVTGVSPANLSLTPETLALDVGDTAALNAEFAYPDGTANTEKETPEIIWASSDESVATVDETGAVTGVAEGAATITAAAGGFATTCDVTVTYSAVTLDTGSLELLVGERATVSITAEGNAAAVSSWEAKPSSDGIVTITQSESGISWNVTGETETEDSITVTVSGSTGGKVYSDSFTVDVTSTAIYDTLRSQGVYPLSAASELIREYSTRINHAASFVTNLSVPSSQGTLFYEYASESDTGAGVASLSKYYFSGADGNLLSKVVFVPRSGFTGTAAITYSAYGSGADSYTGQILISCGSSADTDAALSYVSQEGEAIRLSAADLSAWCEGRYGRALRYVTFGLPSSAEGTLRYNQISDALYEKTVDAATRYYRAGSPNIDDVWFVPRSGYTGSFSLTFAGVDTAGNDVRGSIQLTVRKNSGEAETPAESLAITYTLAAGQRVYFDTDDFADACKRATGRELSYIRLSSAGSLYYGSASASTSYAYYRTASGARRTIDNLNFRAGTYTRGTYNIGFTGTDTAGGTFTGTIRVIVGSTASANLNYTVSAGREIWLNLLDFSNASYAATGRELSRIVLDGLPPASRGILYDNTGAALTGISYYRTASNSSSRRLVEDLSFVAASDFTSGSFSIPYGAYDVNGNYFTGSVTFTAMSATSGTTGDGSLTYSTNGLAVAFRSADFIAAAEEKLSYALSSVTFTAPNASVGRLCLSYSSPTRYTVLDTTQEWPVSTLSSVYFQPRAGFRGSTYIPYSAKDVTGKVYTGYVTVQVTPPTASSYYLDMGGAAWAVPSVDFLSYYGILEGTANRIYSPAGQTKRGDFVLMLSRTFSFPGAGSSGFADVPSGMYYAPAIAAAKNAGVISADEEGNFRPEERITREDAAVMLYRSMARTGSVPSGTYADLAGFSDRDAISPDAVRAMAVLVRLGVFVGDDLGRLNPASTLTRAEMAALLHRALT